MDSRYGTRSCIRSQLVVMLAALVIAQPATALDEMPAGTLVADSGDGAITYRVIDDNGNLVFDIEVSGAATGNGVYLDIDTIDSTAATSPGSIVVDVSASMTIDVTNTNAGTLTRPERPPLDFSGIESLIGGTGDDTFNLNASLSGLINGGAGSDSIVGSSSPNSFNVTASNGGSLNTTLFANIENLAGGADVDTFSFAATLTGTAQGGAGNDTFNLNTIDFGGVATGGAGDDQFNVNVSQSGTLDGADGDDTFNLNTAGFAGTATGGAGNDQFNVNASQSGQLNGDEGSDTFTFTDGATMTFAGTAIDGGPDAAGDDTDTLDVSAHASALSLVLTGSTANTGYAGTEATIFTGAGGGFDGIDTVTGSGDDTLTGLVVASTWTRTTYSDGTELLTFNGMQIAIAGTPGTQTLEGDDGGVDTADTFATMGPGLVSLNGQDFQNIDVLDALNDADTLVGLPTANAFVVNTAGGGTANDFSFANIENLSGGSGADTFEFTAQLSGTAAGGGGNDTFSINDGGSAGATDGGGGSDELTYAGSTGPVTLLVSSVINIETLTGSASAADSLLGTVAIDTFVMSGVDAGTVNGVAFSGFENLDGLEGNDVFNLNGFLSGTVNGGLGNDSIIGPAAGSAFVVSGQDSGTVNGMFFVSVENLIGGAANDTFIFDAAISGSASGGIGDDAFEVAPNLIVSIDGGAGTDVAVINGPTTNDLGITDIESVVFIPEHVVYKVQGTVNSVSADLASVFSVGNNFELRYAFEARAADTQPSADTGLYDAVIRAEVEVGSYFANLSPSGLKRITVLDNLSGIDRYRVDLAGVTGPSAAGLPIGDQFPIFLLTDFTGVAFTDDTLPVTGLDLEAFKQNDFLALRFVRPDASNAIVQASVDSFEVIPAYRDVPESYWAATFISKLGENGITAGCGLANYCPEDKVTRAQMAVFLERGMRGGDFVPPAASGNVFFDIGSQDFAAAFIEQLASDGITGGCGGGNFCPNDNVTRAQMAVFLLRAKYGQGYLPPPPQGIFADVDLGYWAVAWIEQLLAEGITSGCGGGNYCPDAPATRAQMAVFLVRTFDL